MTRSRPQRSSGSTGRPTARLVAAFVLLLAGFALGACAAADSGDACEAYRRYAETIGREQGLSAEAAIERLRSDDPAGSLNAALELCEAETFAGLWLQHEPDERVVVAFTRHGRQTLKPYLAGRSLGIVEVRTVERSLAELITVQRQVMQLVADMGFPFASSVNVQENRVQLFVTDRAQFEASLQAAGRSLPEHVEVVVAYEPLGGVPNGVTPVPEIAFPQLRTRSADLLQALLEGTLVVQDGCLRVVAEGAGQGVLVIWQADYFLTYSSGRLEIWDREGRAVARVGETVRMGGGEVPASSFERSLREPLPGQCPGPYWLMGEVLPR